MKKFEEDHRDSDDQETSSDRYPDEYKGEYVHNTEPTDPAVYAQSDPDHLVEDHPEQGDPGTFTGEYSSPEDTSVAYDERELAHRNAEEDRSPDVDRHVSNDELVEVNQEEKEKSDSGVVPGTYAGEYRKA